MGSDKARPAFAEDFDETSGQTVRGTKKSARTSSVKPPKVHRESSSRKERRSRDGADDHALAIQHVEVDKEVKMDRRTSGSHKTSSPRKSSGRPPATSDTRGFSKVSVAGNSRGIRDDQSYYGIPSPTQVSSSPSIPISLAHRPAPRSSQTYPARPPSFHSSQTGYGQGTAPPLSMSAYYQPQMAQPTYPPTQQQPYRYAAPLQVTQPQQDYFSQQLVSRPLADRFGMVQTRPSFDPVSRTASAWGTRGEVKGSPPSEYWGKSYDDDGYNSASEVATIRRPSARRTSILRNPPMTKAEEALAMPPPPRPSGMMRRTTDTYPIEAPDVDDYRSPRSEYPEPPRPRRPSTNRHSVSYNLGTGNERVTVEAANSGRRRRQSLYEQPSSAGSSYEQQMHQATSYQEDVGATAPLTAAMLKRQEKRHAGSSRSTKSSASRDESDYRKSVTTRTTRSGSGNDEGNMTVKVTGANARITVDNTGNTQIDCSDGGAVEIRRSKSQRHGGSERSNSVYGGRTIEDRPRGRDERTERPRAAPSRMSSHSRTSYMRTSPHTSPQYATHPDYF